MNFFISKKLTTAVHHFQSSAKNVGSKKVDQESSDGDGGLLKKEPELNEDIKLGDMKKYQKNQKNAEKDDIQEESLGSMKMVKKPSLKTMISKIKVKDELELAAIKLFILNEPQILEELNGRSLSITWMR